MHTLLRTNQKGRSLMGKQQLRRCPPLQEYDEITNQCQCPIGKIGRRCRRQAAGAGFAALAPMRLSQWQHRNLSYSTNDPPAPMQHPTGPTLTYHDSDVCGGHGVFNVAIDECRCTAGWAGARCGTRAARPCNWSPSEHDVLHHDALCAGNCDENHGFCYCAGLDSPFQRPLPYQCAPAAHRRTRLPDGRPAYPVWTSRSGGGGGGSEEGAWHMANIYFERQEKHEHFGWARALQTPIEWLYGQVPGNPVSPRLQRATTGAPGTEYVPFCSAAAASAPTHLLRCGGGCPEGRTGPLCEDVKQSFCLRDCMGRGECESGFCWCRNGWFGIDCSMRMVDEAGMVVRRKALKTYGGDADGAVEGAPLRETSRSEVVLARSLQSQQRLPSPVAAKSNLKIYVYDMPSEFTSRLLQWKGFPSVGLSRAIDIRNRSIHASGSLYALELALHEWLLDSPLRTVDAREADLFYVPIYLASIFMWPIVKHSDEPYLGRERREPRQRSHQGTLLMLQALRYISTTFPFWNASKGRDHVWLMLHDEGPCFCPKAIRSSILLTHYGYYAASPRPWTTFDDDNFLLDRAFYQRYLGDPRAPTRCFDRHKDIVVAPWKKPSFWLKALQKLHSGPLAKKTKLVFFAGDLGFGRVSGYSRDLRQLAFALFCNPKTTRPRDCTPVAYDKACDCECRPDLPQNCSLWEPGVTIITHSAAYHAELSEHTFCLAFPGAPAPRPRRLGCCSYSRKGVPLRVRAAFCVRTRLASAQKVFSSTGGLRAKASTYRQVPFISCAGEPLSARFAKRVFSTGSELLQLFRSAGISHAFFGLLLLAM
uniref:EGF-like domain-containing protein n=1 Tax=Chrysotila carterae TaxID=13221 RepID=A0A7S4B6Y3_CHRCT